MQKIGIRMQKLEIGNGKLELTKLGRKNWKEKIGIGMHLLISLCC